LQVAKGDRSAARDDLSGDALADGNGPHHFNHCRRQTGLGDEVKQLFFGIKPVNRAGFGPELFEDFAQGFFQNRFAGGAAFQEPGNWFVQLVHTIICISGPDG